MGKNQNKRSWRKLIKKLQRKRRRQKFASKRDKDLQEIEEGKLNDPLYKSWLENQEEIQRLQQLHEEKQHQHEEEQWLRRELLAQKQFRIDERNRKLKEDKLEEERLKQEQALKEQQEAQRKKREALKLQAEKAAKEFDEILQSMQEYLDRTDMKTPPRLECFVESRPNEKTCEFYDKTNCCRFGSSCTFNHRRPILAKIIVIRHFFHHPLLGQEEHNEYYKADSHLELNERDLRESYDEFCEDVWPVLEEFGNIINFQTVRNTHPHLRGHVFVEYAEKRSALKAFINLQNRYYASKRLNVEFSNIINWRNGVCGMDSDFLQGLSLGRKCPKGVTCNFLHLMKNVDNKYNTPMHNPERMFNSVTGSTKLVSDTPKLSWNDADTTSSRSHSWRWSESPEVELKTYKEKGVKNLIEKNFETRSKTQEAYKSSSHSRSISKKFSSESSSRKRISSKNYKSYKKSKHKRSKSPSEKRNKISRR